MITKKIIFSIKLLLCVIAYGQNVGINTTTPKSTLEINGSFGTAIQEITNPSAFALDGTHQTLIFRGTGGTITLPDPTTCKGREYTLVNFASGSITTNIAFDAGTGTKNTITSQSVDHIKSNGTSWIKTDNAQGSGASNPWILTGNAGTTAGTNFIGTTDAQDLVFKTNNNENIRIQNNGLVGIGLAYPYGIGKIPSYTPSYVLDVAHEAHIVSNRVNFSSARLILEGLQVDGGNQGDGIFILDGQSNGSRRQWYMGKGYGSYGSGGYNNFIIQSQLTDTFSPAIPSWGTASSVTHMYIDALNKRIGIGTVNPGNTLEIQSTTAGTSGLRFTNLTNAVSLSTNATGDIIASTLNPANGFYWGLTGNSGTIPSTNFIGTSDDKDIVFKRSGTTAGYIGGSSTTNNTAFGDSSLPYAATNTRGFRNTAIGAQALPLNPSTSNDNVAVGYSTLGQYLTAGGAGKNTAIGGYALSGLRNGDSNVAVGNLAGVNNTVNYMGTGNTFLGAQAGYNISSSPNNNTFIGYNSGGYAASTSVGSGNTAIGAQANIPNPAGNNQLSIANSIFGTGMTGTVAAPAGNIGINTTTPGNTLEIKSTTAGASGLRFTNLASVAALATNASGDVIAATPNTANGVFWGLTGNSGTTAGTHFIGTTDNQDIVFKRNGILAGRINNTNISLGTNTLAATTGVGNTAMGMGALTAVTSGNSNIGVGQGAGGQITTGQNNTLLGTQAGTNITTANNDIIIGMNVPAPSPTVGNQMNIGNAIFGTGMTGTVATPAGNIGINTTTPNSTLQVNGSVAANIRSFSGIILDNDYTVLASGNVTLPAATASNKGRIYHIVNDTSGSLTVSGTFRVNGANFTDYGLNTGSGGRSVVVQSNGSEWIVLSGY